MEQPRTCPEACLLSAKAKGAPPCTAYTQDTTGLAGGAKRARELPRSSHAMPEAAKHHIGPQLRAFSAFARRALCLLWLGGYHEGVLAVR